MNVSATDSNGNPWQTDINSRSCGHDTLLNLWGRKHVRQLEDQYASAAAGRESLSRQIVAVSLESRVLSRFTAFVAVDPITVVDGDERHRVIQPVEMPSGWSDDAAESLCFDDSISACLAEPNADSHFSEGSLTDTWGRGVSGATPHASPQPAGRGGLSGFGFGKPHRKSKAGGALDDLAKALKRVQKTLLRLARRRSLSKRLVRSLIPQLRAVIEALDETQDLARRSFDRHVRFLEAAVADFSQYDEDDWRSILDEVAAKVDYVQQERAGRGDTAFWT